MVYTIILNNKSYDLPKKTVTVMERLDSALTIDNNNKLSLRDKYAHLHSFVKDVLGEEKAKECLGSENLDDIDLSELAIVVRKIHDAYDKPIADYQAEKMRAKMGQVPFDKIVPLMNAVNASALVKK